MRPIMHTLMCLARVTWWLCLVIWSKNLSQFVAALCAKTQIVRHVPRGLSVAILRIGRQNRNILFFARYNKLKECGTVATDEYNSMSSMKHDIGLTPITQSLAFLAGGGVVLMILALILGVLNTADAALVNLMLVGGFIMLVTGGVAWMAVSRVYEHYDDINQPAPDEHHEHEAHDEGHESHESHDAHALEQAH